MKFLYTGSTTPLTPQTDRDLSIGGNVSSSIIPNEMIGNLFGDVSWKTIQDRATETKAFVIENDSSQDVVNFNFGYSYPLNSVFKIEYAFVTLTNNTTMERLSSSLETPYYATFAEANVNQANSIDNSVTIPSITSGQRIGVWLRRTITSNSLVGVSCYNEIGQGILQDPCCEQSLELINVLSNQIKVLSPITISVNGDFQIPLGKGRVLEWVLFKVVTTFTVKIGTTLNGSEILQTPIVDSQPVLVMRNTQVAEIIYFSSIPVNTVVTYKIS